LIVFGTKDNTTRCACVGLKGIAFPPMSIFMFSPVSIPEPTVMRACAEGPDES